MQVTVASIEDAPEVGNGSLGDRARQFDDVVSRNLRGLYNSAFRCLGNAADAEDAVQDALLSAYKHLAQFRGQARISTWLTSIVINAARMKLRRRRGVWLSLEQPQGEDGLALSERIPDLKPSPEDACFASEARARLLEVSSQLSPTLRRTFQLRDIEGLSTKETALRLGVPEGTVKAQVARARGKLTRIMQRARRQPSQSVFQNASALQADSVCP
jgi:RNA polymerase sigma-70 factor, ECF subfamily